MKPMFITFEGGEGSGKSVQAKLLSEALQKKGISVVQTKEPGGTEVGTELRKILVQGSKDKLDYISEMLLYYADRRIHLTSKIWPALKENKWVISDRYADSTVAYQYYGYDCRIEKQLLEKMYKIVVGDFKPDLTIILDIAPEKGLGRSFKKAETMNEKELRFEQMDMTFHQNIRNGFLQIAEENPERCVVVDAEGSVQEIHEKIKQLLAEKIGIEL